MQLLSPKQVAKSIGVSESSLKRWCDQGLIRTEKTPGGHRRMLVGDVVSFLRSTNRPIKQADLLGLPEGVGKRSAQATQIGSSLNEALEKGQEQKCRRLILDSYLGGNSAVEICESLLAPAMHRLGELWECGNAEVFQERLACEIVGRLMYDLRSVLPSPRPDAPLAIGGAPEGDHYRLPTLMVQMAMLEAGWRAVSLGDNLPYKTIQAAVIDRKPALVWISMSRVGNPDSWRRELEDFATSLPARTQVIAGGRAIADTKPEELTSVKVGSTLADLQEMAKDLLAKRDGARNLVDEAAKNAGPPGPSTGQA